MGNSKERRKLVCTIENEFVGEGFCIELFTEEITSICPITDLPDFYKLRILYKPKEKLIELKRLRDYLLSFKN
jgi:7-cyano-7-deazaguanine reductase